MPTYIFNGKVLPERASVTIGPIEPVTAVIPDISLRFQATITICASQILIAVNIDNSIKDVETLRNCVEAIVRNIDSLVKTRFEEVPAISHICALPYVGVVYGTETVYCTPARVRLF